MAIKIGGITVIYDDKIFQVGSGTTAQRPASPATGMLRYNTDLGTFEGYSGGTWSSIPIGSIPKLNGIQIGQSSTDTQNFVIAVPTVPDGTLKLSRGNSGGVLSDILTVDASNTVEITGKGAIATTSGTETLTNKTISFANNTLLGIQPTLVSGTDIKTINGNPILGTGDLLIKTGLTKYIGGGVELSGTLNAVYDSLPTYIIPDLTTQANTYGILGPNGITPPASYNLTGGWKLSVPTAANQILAPYPVACKHGIWAGAEYLPPIYDSATVTTTAISSAVSLSNDLHILMGSSSWLRAYNSTTKTWGTQVSGVGGTLYKTSSTSFVSVAYNNWSGAHFQNITAYPATVSGTTINMGASVLIFQAYTQTDAVTHIGTYQLSDTLFVTFYTKTDPGSAYAKAFTVSGTTITLGTEVSINNLSLSSAAADVGLRASIIDSSNLLISYLSAGGTSSTRALVTRVLSVAGTTITLNTAVTGSSIYGERIAGLIKFSSTEFAVAVKNGAGTALNWHGVSVSGTTVTVGALNSSSISPTLTFAKIYLVGTTALIILGTTSVFGVTLSGTTLTIGTPLTVPMSGYSKTDAKTNSLVYVFDDATDTLRRLSVSGTTVSVAETIVTSARPRTPWIYSDTLNEEVVSIGGTYYARKLSSTQVDWTKIYTLSSGFIASQVTNNLVILKLSDFEVY